MNLKIPQFIKDSGKVVLDMEEVNNIGMTDHSMKDIGKTTWLTVKGV